MGADFIADGHGYSGKRKGGEHKLVLGDTVSSKDCRRTTKVKQKVCHRGQGDRVGYDKHYWPMSLTLSSA